VTRPRVLVIGLDGAEPNSTRFWAETGVMPFLRDMMQDGASGVLRSTIPPYTPTAWTSIVTGVNPGRHGVFGFTRWTEDGREVLVDSSVCRCKTIWDYLTEQDRSSVVVNVPVTYPPRPLRGVLVSGMGTPRDAELFSSSSALQELVAQIAPGYVPDVAVGGGAAASERRALAAVDEIERALGQRLALTEHLVTTEPWEFAMVVLEAPDRIQHLFWKDLEPAAPGSSKQDRLLGIYRKIDQGMRRLVAVAERAGPVVIIVVSDHGFQPLDWNLFINNQLIDAGLLTLRSRPSVAHLARLMPSPLRRAAAGVVGRTGLGAGSASSAIDWGRTKAFAGRVFEQGVYVRNGGDPVSSRAEVKAVLESMPGPDGGKVVREVKAREAVYSGPHVSKAPALFPLLDLPGVMMAGSLSHRGLWEAQPGPFGTHHEDGIIVAAGPGVVPTRDIRANAQDVAPTVLQLLGGGPPDLDGMNIDSLGASPLPRIPDRVERDDAEPSGYSAKQEEEIVAHLQGLGYFE
jgi:predicted AlkP superfamily phosphohydrolase/phosphomutase